MRTAQTTMWQRGNGYDKEWVPGGEADVRHPRQVICADCGRVLVRDEIGLSRKLIGRATVEFCCLACLAARFSTDETTLRAMIERFRATGCTLFC